MKYTGSVLAIAAAFFAGTLAPSFVTQAQQATHTPVEKSYPSTADTAVETCRQSPAR
jgi:hypothetical protein